MAERLSVFGMVVGVALLLTGIGFVILAVAVFRRPELATDLRRRRHPASSRADPGHRRSWIAESSDLPEQEGEAARADSPSVSAFRSCPQMESVLSRTKLGGARPIIRRMAAHARRILVGFDGSEASQRALDAAADLVGYGSSLAVVHVRRAGAPQGRTVELARERLLRRQLTARYLEPCGHPAKEIVEAARAVSADLIVVGRRNALRRVLGPVSGSVVQRAPCDVLVVR